MRICSIEGCLSKHKGYGYCDKHYQRLKRHGDVTVCFAKKYCSANDCEEIHYGNGLCNKHYLRKKFHNDLNHERGPKYKSPLEAYEAMVIRTKENKCWEWKGSRHDWGYGAIPYKKQKLSAHRFAYETFVAPIPEGMFVCHHCDNPICSNPSHLFLGTNLDNIKDCVKKGRHPFLKKNRINKGEEHGEA